MHTFLIYLAVLLGCAGFVCLLLAVSNHYGNWREPKTKYDHLGPVNTSGRNWT